MKKFTFILAMSVFLLWSADSFAKLKIWGDLKQNLTWRSNLDLNADGNNVVSTRGHIGPTMGTQNFGGGDGQFFFNTLLGLNFDWSLVKDTNFHLRLASQFDWLGTNTVGPLSTHVLGGGPNNQNNGDESVDGAGTNPFSMWVNQAHLTFNDFAGFPVNLKVGRQNVWLGKGFVMGNRLYGAGHALYAGGFAPSGSLSTGGNGQNNFANQGNLPLNSISGGSIFAPETADFTGFDGVTANIHLMGNKLNIDFGYLLISGALTQSAAGAKASNANVETYSQRNSGFADDETLWFANLGYKTRTWNVEAYYLFNKDDEPLGDNQNSQDTGGTTNYGTGRISADKINTLGLRGDFDWGKGIWLFKNINTFAEAAMQMGDLGSAARVANINRKRSASALNVGLNTWLTTKYSPSFGLEGVFFSGAQPQHLETAEAATGAATITVGEGTKWKAWDPVFRGQFFTKIMDFMDAVYLTDTVNMGNPASTSTGNAGGKLDAGFTNRLLLLARAGIKPAKKLDVGLTFAKASAAEPAQAGASKDFGFEIDWDVAYKLSKVASWTFDGGVFFPGKYYAMPDVAGGEGKSRAILVRTGFKVNLGG